MAPNIASLPSFQHKPLLGVSTVRVLHVRSTQSGTDDGQAHLTTPGVVPVSFELIEVFLADYVDKYQAVSYAWGLSAKNHHITIEEQYSLPITQSLATALPYLIRSCSTGYLWIDQICIDQSNIAERNQQVSVMGDIFSNALEVLIWTGGEIKGLEKVLKRSEKLDNGGKVSLKRSDMKPIMELLRRSWFSRGWVIQEAVMAKEALVMAGSCVFTIIDLVSAWIIQNPHPEPADVRIGGATFEMIMALRQNSLVNFGFGFDGLLNGCGNVQTTDPRDHVFAFLGLNPDPRITIIPQYDASVAEVFTNAARAMVQGTQSLSHFRLLPSTEMSDGTKLPSWVPNWSKKHDMSAILSRPDLGEYLKASKKRIHRTNVSEIPKSNILHVSGRIIDEVLRELPNPGFRISQTIFAPWRMPPFDRVYNKINSTLRRKPGPPPLFFGWTNDQVQEIDPTALADPSQALRHRIVSAISGARYDSDKLLAKYDGLTEWDSSGPMNYHSMEYTFNEICTYRLWYTVGGKFALVPRLDDGNYSSIAIIHGSNAPVVLSSGVGGTYTVGGYCYLENAMYGDACTWEEDDADVLALS